MRAGRRGLLARNSGSEDVDFDSGALAFLNYLPHGLAEERWDGPGFDIEYHRPGSGGRQGLSLA